MKNKKKCKVWGDHKFKPIGYHYDWPDMGNLYTVPKTVTILKCTKCGMMYHGELHEYKEQNSGLVTLNISSTGISSNAVGEKIR